MSTWRDETNRPWYIDSDSEQAAYLRELCKRFGAQAEERFAYHLAVVRLTGETPTLWHTHKAVWMELYEIEIAARYESVE